MAPASAVQTVIADGATAFVTLLSMTFGLIIPRLCLEHPPAGRVPAA